MRELKNGTYKFYKPEIKRFDFHIPLIEKEIDGGRDSMSTIAGYGFIYQEELCAMAEYLRQQGKEDLIDKFNLPTDCA